MRALVTGITGFVGGHLAERLLAQGDRVIGCSRRGVWPDELRHLAPRVTLVACDLCDPAAVARLLDRELCDTAYHLAGLANPRACAADPELARRENTEATRNLYEAVRQSGQRPRVLFVSTSYVYGQPRAEELPIRVTCPIRPQHPYAASKWAAEELSVRYAAEHGLDVVRVRPFNHTGPRQSLRYIVPDWVQQIAAMEAGRARPVLRVGSLDTRRDYTDVRDVVRGYWLLAGKAPSRTVYNLGSGVARSGREILGVLRSLSRVPFDLEPDPGRARSGEAAEIVADPAPLQELTGWRPEIDLETTLRDTLNYWHSRQGGGS